MESRNFFENRELKIIPHLSSFPTLCIISSSFSSSLFYLSFPFLGDLSRNDL